MTKQMSEITPEQITAMPAGPELDAIAARLVLGLEVRGVADSEGMIYTYEHEWAYPGDKYIYLEQDGYQPEHSLPPYSTDIAAAWLLYERLRQSGKWCCLDLHSNHNYQWRFSLRREENHQPNNPLATIDATAENAPEAITKGAVLAALRME